MAISPQTKKRNDEEHDVTQMTLPKQRMQRGYSFVNARITDCARLLAGGASAHGPTASDRYVCPR